ncbi:MAG: Gfo/Idh/MocA family oxidoreductase [Victivallaceae bacterium]|nr:Gfo/Idh/MocA family oxidoreductase [Victivallaceae bacterium]
MAKYKSAILGCGPRAEIHMRAYEGLEEITLQAICDRNPERLKNCGGKYKVPELYSDFEEMLAKERPDILHIVTPPSIREVPIDTAARYGVKGVIVEKPIALDQLQIRKIKEIVQRTGVKVAVNTQRRYFKSCQELKKVLDEKQIGDISFIRCVAKGNILSWGPHVVDLILYFLDDVAPTHIWATAYGMNGYDYGHPAPANMMINFQFPGQITVYCEDAEDAIGVLGETEFWEHVEFDFWGSRGRVWWTRSKGWGYQFAGMTDPRLMKSCGSEDEVPGQREFTRAMAHWLDDENKVHLNCLDNAFKGFEVIMGAFQSAYIGKRIEFPAVVPADINEKLEKKIK